MYVLINTIVHINVRMWIVLFILICQTLFSKIPFFTWSKKKVTEKGNDKEICLVDSSLNAYNSQVQERLKTRSPKLYL